MSEIKLNRVHQKTGWIAVPLNNGSFYTIHGSEGVPLCTVPAEIVESDGWQNEQGEIDILMQKISGNILSKFPYKGSILYNNISNLILEFAKNYQCNP